MNNIDSSMSPTLSSSSVNPMIWVVVSIIGLIAIVFILRYFLRKSAYSVEKAIRSGKYPKAQKGIIGVGIVVIIICAIMFAVGQVRMSAADKELKASYDAQRSGNPVTNVIAESRYESDRKMFYLPGEQMRDYSGYGMVAGLGITVWGFYLNYQRKKDMDKK